MKRVACALLSFLLISCTTTEIPRFSDRPFGEAPNATRVDNQKGDAVERKITAENFKELTVAQGSGFSGFEAVRIFSDGSGYAVFGDRNEKAGIWLSEQDLEGLIAALNSDRIMQIKGLYSSGWADGIQGFIEIKTSKGRRYCWLDNHFDPVSNTFAYCNKVIWPKVVGAKIERKGIDPQAEYFRVFYSEQQNKRIQRTFGR